MKFIRLWFVSVLIISLKCYGEEENSPVFLHFTAGKVSLESEIRIEQRFAWGFKHLEMEGVEKANVDFSFSSDSFDHYPIPLSFSLNHFEWEGPNPLSEGGPFPLLVREGKCLQGILLKGALVPLFPFIEFSPEVRKKYRFSLLGKPPFGEEWFTLIEIGKRPLAEGVEFTISAREGSDPIPFNKEVKVLSLSGREVILEVKTVFKRVKLNLEEGKAVVSGNSTAIWKINPERSLLFSVEEEGMMNDSIQIGGSTASRVYHFKRKVNSRAVDL